MRQRLYHDGLLAKEFRFFSINCLINTIAYSILSINCLINAKQLLQMIGESLLGKGQERLDVDTEQVQETGSRNPASAARPPTGEERRQRLVQAAFDLIVEKGFEGLRVRDVAGRVGVNSATLHYYFPGKQDLVRGVVDYLQQQFHIRHTPPTDAGLPLSPLQQELADLSHELQNSPARFVVLLELTLRSLRNPDVRVVLAEMEHGWHDYLTDVCRNEINAGHLRRDIDPAQIASTLIALMKGLSLQTISGFDTFDFTILYREIEHWWQPLGTDNNPVLKGT